MKVLGRKIQLRETLILKTLQKQRYLQANVRRTASPEPAGAGSAIFHNRNDLVFAFWDFFARALAFTHCNIRLFGTFSQ